MSALTKRRWSAFRANRRALVSLILLSFVFTVSLFAEIVANSQPLLVKMGDEILFPAFETLTEKDLGGEFETAPDFQDPYTLSLLEKADFVLWAPVRCSYATVSPEPVAFPSPPSLRHILGTDDEGRDIFARLLYGFRLSVLFGLALAAFSSAVGIAAGLIQGYYGGWADLAGQRFIEIWGSVPVLFLIIIVSSFTEMTFWLMLSIMLLFSWMRLVGLVRAETLKARSQDYVLAAKALGVKDARIMRIHILPNALVATVSVLPFVVNASIAALTSLDFLGFGLPPSYPSLGEVLAQGKNNLFAPWIGISGFLTIAGLLMALVFIGEGLRDAFDPRVFLSSEEK